MLNEKQIADQVERSFIRGAIYSLPRRWKWIGMVVLTIGTVIAHHYGLV